MKLFTMRYPGDPPVEVRQLTRAEFFNLFPPDDRVVTVTSDLGIEEYPCNAELHCDLCYADPGATFWLLGMSRAYCDECMSHNQKYLTPND